MPNRPQDTGFHLDPRPTSQPADHIRTRQPRPCEPPKSEGPGRLRRWHALRSWQALAKTLAAVYLFGAQLGSDRRHTFRSVSHMFDVPLSTCHRMVAAVDRADALAQAQRLGLVKPHADLTNVPKRAGSPELAEALALVVGDGHG